MPKKNFNDPMQNLDKLLRHTRPPSLKKDGFVYFSDERGAFEVIGSELSEVFGCTLTIGKHFNVFLIMVNELSFNVILNFPSFERISLIRQRDCWSVIDHAANGTYRANTSTQLKQVIRIIQAQSHPSDQKPVNIGESLRFASGIAMPKPSENHGPTPGFAPPKDKRPSSELAEYVATTISDQTSSIGILDDLSQKLYGLSQEIARRVISGQATEIQDDWLSDRSGNKDADTDTEPASAELISAVENLVLKWTRETILKEIDVQSQQASTCGKRADALLQIVG